MKTTISNTDDVIDSRDVIARIEELQDEIQAAQDNGDEHGDESAELDDLLALQSQAESSPDWIHGEQLIADHYFVQHITELIDDCYEMPDGLNSGDWPYRHMKMDYEAAADEAKSDYMEVSFGGNDYLIRA